MKGATTIYALHLPAATHQLPLGHSLSDVAGRAMSAWMQQQMALDCQSVANARGVTLHYIELCPPSHLELSVRDFSRSTELIASGREQTGRYLATRRTRPASRRERLVVSVRKTTGQVRAALRGVTDERPLTLR